jgi:hypothetical protein
MENLALYWNSDGAQGTLVSGMVDKGENRNRVRQVMEDQMEFGGRDGE